MGVFYQGANRKYEGEFGAIALFSETGTRWQNLCEDAQTLTETRFLSLGDMVSVTGRDRAPGC